MKQYILETSNGFAAFDFRADEWRTVDSSDDADALYCIEAESLEGAVSKFGELVGGIRYHRTGSCEFQDMNLNPFFVLPLPEMKMEDRRFRVVGERKDKRIVVHCSGPLTHKEGCTVLSKITKYPWRIDRLDQIN